MAESNLILVNPPKKVKKMAARKGTKASRSAAAKKAAATRKRNAAKRSAAAKKAAATRKRNAGKKKTTAKRKASRSTASKRSAAAKKAAATRKRNAAKRSRAAKKAAATRKRNSGKRKSPAKRKSSSTKRSTKASRSRAAKKAAATRKRNAAKRSRAAKKAAATRKRNSRGKKRSVKSRKGSPARRKGRMTKAQRSAAAKKAWRTRRRNGNAGRKSKRTTRGRRRAKTSRAFVQKAGKNTYDSAMKAVNALPGYGLMAVYGAFAIGAYNAIKPMVWDRIGVESYVGSAADKIGQFTTPNIGADIGNFTNKAIAVGTIAALGHLVSSKKALGLIDPKLTTSAVGIAGLFYGAKFISEIATMNLGNTLQALATGDFSGASNQFMAGTHMGMLHGGHNLGKSIGYPTSNGGNSKFFGGHKQLPMFGAHNNNMGMMHGAHNNMGMMHGGHNLGMAMAGNKGLMNQMQSANTSALQMGGNKSGFFGTGRSLGATRVNLF